MSTETTRESQLLDAVSALTETMVSDYDVVEVAQILVETCTNLFDVEAAGLLVVGMDGVLEVLASTSEASRLIEVLQIDAQAGPCLDCFRTGQLVSVPDISVGPERWRLFIDRAQDLHFRSVHAIPLRHRDVIIGTLNLLGTRAGVLNGPDLKAARALADVTTLGILNDRSSRQQAIVQRHLELALSSRVTIEQAKGFVAHRKNISVDDAFRLLRGYARSHRLRLVDVATGVVTGRLELDEPSPRGGIEAAQ
jgi:GAF domain-containing protein